VKRNPTLFVVLLALSLVLVAFLFTPVVLSLLAGVTVNFQDGLGSGFTGQWVAQVLELYTPSVGLSLLVAFSCLAVVLVLGVPAAYGFSRGKAPGLSLLEDLLLLPMAVPGLASALGLLLVYGSWTAFRGSWLFILVGHVLFTLPFLIRPVQAVLGSVDLKAQEETASTLGAGPLKRFFTVVIPAARGGIVSGSLMVLALSFGEFNLTWMLHTPDTKTLPVGLADSYASLRLEVASAYTLVFFVLIVPLLVLIQLFGNPPSGKKVRS